MDNGNLFDLFFSVSALKSVKEQVIFDEIQSLQDKKDWYYLFLVLSIDTTEEIFLVYYYYRFIYIPNAKSVQGRLEADYETSNFRRLMDGANIKSSLPNNLSRVVDELVNSGYITVSHKLEDIQTYVQRHSVGKPYGKMNYEFYIECDYVELLKTDFQFELANFFQGYVPRLKLIRTYSNCLKHRNGYPNLSTTNDKNLFLLLGRDEANLDRIIRTSDEFEDDTLYSILSIYFFFGFVRRVHKMFILLSNRQGVDDELTKEKAKAIDGVKFLCEAIKTADSNPALFDRLIGYKKST